MDIALTLATTFPTALGIAALSVPSNTQLLLHAQTAFLHGFTRGLVGGAALLLLGALFVAVRAPGRAESRSNATAKSIGPAATEGAGS